jgi:hypothetical protein
MTPTDAASPSQIRPGLACGVGLTLALEGTTRTEKWLARYTYEDETPAASCFKSISQLGKTNLVRPGHAVCLFLFIYVRRNVRLLIPTGGRKQYGFQRPAQTLPRRRR